MTKPMSELFSLPLAVVPACHDPHWGTSIVEADDPVVWTINRVNPRTTGGFAAELLVSAQERAEAIVAAVNERDGMQAVIANLLYALFLVTADEFSMQEFRALPVVAQAEKYARDWAKEMAE